MHFRVSRRRKGGTIYRYGQLVQSFRRPDGMPAHRVLANLGPVSELEAENLKLAFKASKRGEAVVVADDAASVLARRKCQANFAYLALAVCLDLWRRWRLGALIDQLAPDDGVEVPVASVLAALVLQRCLAPDSKLAAVSWFPTTALPELLDVSPTQFNNTRIHRALDVLELIEVPLQEVLAKRITAGGPVRVLFLDCSDTWFVGRGPQLASMRLTKEGLYRRSVGIALLCDGDGLPLQWATVRGNHDERKTMLRMARAVAGKAWAHQVPFVMDRAMGSASVVHAVDRCGLRFLTAVPSNEFSAWSRRIPLGGFAGLTKADEPLGTPDHLERLVERAQSLGFEESTKGRFLLDLGVVTREGEPTADGLSRARLVLWLARKAHVELDDGQTSRKQIAERWGVTLRQLRKWLSVLRLSPDVKLRIEAGDADRLSVDTLLELGRLPPDEQPDAIVAAISKAGDGDMLVPKRKLAELADRQSLSARAIVTFAPDLFVRERGAAEDRLRSTLEKVAELNERARSPNSRRSAHSLLGEVAAIARKNKLTQIIDARIETYTTTQGNSYHQAIVEVDDHAWRAQRAADGINLVIAHRDSVASAESLVQLYFDKDKVEKDFRTIKSVMELRPVHHRTDPKVRAHVTLCVLALLLERTLEQKLRSRGIQTSARAAYDILSTCFLNLFTDISAPIYTATQVTPDQRALLDALDLNNLVDDEAVARTITPR